MSEHNEQDRVHSSEPAEGPVEKMTPKELGDLAVKFATDTAYAAAGFADVVAEKARELVDKQRANFADTDEAEASGDSTKAFLDQITKQVNKLVEDLGHAYKDLADRGRDAVAKMQQPGAKAESKDAPGPFDLDDAADVASDVKESAEDFASDAAKHLDEDEPSGE